MLQTRDSQAGNKGCTGGHHWILPLMMLIMFFGAASCQANSITLVGNGATRCCVIVGLETAFKEPSLANWDPQSPLMYWAAEDVATYLGKMSGAKVPIGEKPVEGLLPIYIGCPPEDVKLAHSTEFGDAYVIDVSNKRIILHGESRRAVYYAAARLLTNLGVRWYAPGDIGEVVPLRQTITVETGRIESFPDFTTRSLWMAGDEQQRWSYRNGMGYPAPCIPCGHSLHGLVSDLPGWKDGEEGRALHPEYYNLYNGKPYIQINLAHPKVAQTFASKAIEILRAGPPDGVPGGKQSINSISVSPDDGYMMDERPEVLAMNSPGRDTILGIPCFSDAWFTFLNRVCAEIDKQAPDVKGTLGSLAFRNYLLPPRTVKPDPRIIPVIAPFTFNRFTSMGTPGAPTSVQLEEAVKEWTAISPRVGMYLYNFNLSDMAMPYTRRVHWTRDFPRLYALGIKDISIESHPCWHTMMPGNYVAARLLWDVKTDVSQLLDEYYPNYYGPATESMRRYDSMLEQAYETTKAFAGATWSMHRILTPDVMKQLDAALTEAEQQAKGQGVFAQRVDIARYSLNNAKNWFAARDALNRFDLAEAEQQGLAFIANLQAGNAKYPLFFPPKMEWSPNPETYFELLHNRSFKDAGRIARVGTIVYKFPDEWLAYPEMLEGGALPTGRIPDLNKTENWRPFKTYSATIDEQGLTFFRGVLWYQHTFELPRQAGKATWLKLWFGGVTRITHAYLNGVDLGEQRVRNFGPVEYDITASIHREGKNTLLVASDDTYPTEIGMGGIVRPVLIYAPK